MGGVGGGRWHGVMTAIAQHPHRVTTAVATVRAELAQVADASLWSMDATQTGTTLAEVQKVKAQTAELEARLLAHAETIDLPGQSGATSTANWLAHHTRTTRREAHRLTRVAAGLESHEATRTALADGAVNLEQAEAILRGLDTLPDDLDPDLVTKAEEHLIGLARDFDAKALKNLSRRAPGGHRPGRGRRPRSQAAREGGGRRPGRHPVHLWEDSRGTAPGQLHARPAHRGDVQEGRPRVRRTQAPRRRRSPRRPQADPGTPRPRLRRAHPALPGQQAPQGRWPHRHGRGPHAVRHVDGRAQGRQARHRRDHLRPASPDGSPARPGSSPPSSAAGPRSSTSAGPNASTPAPSGSSRPSNRAAASRRAATGHPACTQMHHPTPWAEGGEHQPRRLDALPLSTPPSPRPQATSPRTDSPTARSASPGGRELPIHALRTSGRPDRGCGATQRRD